MTPFENICLNITPSPSLRKLVKCYHIRWFQLSGTDSLPFKPYAPRPEQTLAFFPRGYELVEYPESQKLIRRTTSTIIGQPTERTNRHLVGSEFCVILVNFYPGVLYRLTGIPFTEFTNTFADAESIFSHHIRDVSVRLNSSNDCNEMIEVIEEFLLFISNRIKKDAHPIDNIANRLVDGGSDQLLSKLSSEVFLSKRQFERKFKERMGVNASLFTRIARMNQAVRYKYNVPKKDWSTIAIHCGYYDYQHLVKDFLDLAGVTPTTYLLQENLAPERAFGLRDSSM